LHDAIGHIGVQRIIAGEDLDVVLLDQILALEDRLAHLDTQCFGFVAPGYHTAIIVGQHQYRSAVKGAIKRPLT
jgi:hypothetical protein